MRIAVLLTDRCQRPGGSAPQASPPGGRVAPLRAATRTGLEGQP